ncbi:MAG: hypothetical protein ABGY42_04855, partial [bacterium]
CKGFELVTPAPGKDWLEETDGAFLTRVRKVATKKFLWARVVAGEVRSSYARFVVTKTRELTALEAAWVDAEVAESADGRIPWTRFEALVVGKVAAAAPELAREKEERARRATFAKIVGTPEHGMASFLIRAPIPVIAQLDATIGALAERLREQLPDDPHAADPLRQPVGEEQPDEATTVVCADERRVLAVLMLANPDTAPENLDIRNLVPKVEVVVHLDGHEIDNDSGTGGAPASAHAWPTLGQQPAQPAGVVQTQPPVTSGLRAGPTVERFDLESRVVCNRRLAKLLDHRTRLGDRIRPVVTALVGKLHLARPRETDQLDRLSLQQRPNLAQLAGVAGGDHQALHARSSARA